MTEIKDHANMRVVVSRVLFYSVLLLGSHWISDTWFSNANLANVAIFTLFITAFELVTGHAVSFARMCFLCLCVALFLMAGLFLVHEASCVQTVHTIQR